MRIGVADTQGTEQSTRTYHPVYPSSLDEFKLIYPGQNALRKSTERPPAHPLPPQVAIDYPRRAKRSPLSGS